MISVWEMMWDYDAEIKHPKAQQYFTVFALGRNHDICNDILEKMFLKSLKEMLGDNGKLETHETNLGARRGRQKHGWGYHEENTCFRVS